MNSNKINVNLIRKHSKWQEYSFINTEFIRSIISKSLEAAKYKGINTEISVILMSDIEIKEMNNKYRGKNYATNVLSFPYSTIGEDGYIGDIALGLEVLTDEAVKQSKFFKDHFTHIVIHGTLHIIGYDHMDAASAEVMENLEISILSSMGIANPYIINSI